MKKSKTKFKLLKKHLKKNLQLKLRQNVCLNKTTMKLHKPTTRLLNQQPILSMMMMLTFFKKKIILELIIKKLMKEKTMIKIIPTTQLKLNKKKIKIHRWRKITHLKDSQRFKKGQQ